MKLIEIMLKFYVKIIGIAIDFSESLVYNTYNTYNFKLHIKAYILRKKLVKLPILKKEREQ